MIEALTQSANHDVASTCRKILNSPNFNVELYHKTCGSFMRAVLDGDSTRAISKADRPNRRCLKRAAELKSLNFTQKYSVDL